VCARDGVAVNYSTVYDLAAAKPGFLAALDEPTAGILRYTSLLPVDADDIAAPDVGGTPLVEAPRIAAEVGVARLWVKDESRGPTWSFKDRASVVAAAHARKLGHRAIVASSTGNAAAATAAHAARVGIPAVILFAKGVDPVMAAFVQAFGAHVVVTPTKADRWDLMRHSVEALGCYPNSTYTNPPVGNNPWTIDGYKTIGYEIWEQLGRSTPTDILFPVCYGDALFGVFKAFGELREMGLVDESPRLGGGEIYGSLEHALETSADRPEAAPVDGPTTASSNSSPQGTYQALHAVRSTAGWVSRVSEDELVHAERLLAEGAGLFVERAAAASLAGLIRQVADGRVTPDAEVVLIGSSSGLKSISHHLDGPEPQMVTDAEELAVGIDRLLAGDASTRRTS
jgi:threonine synthase